MSSEQLLYDQEAEQRINDSGIREKSISELHLPDVQTFAAEGEQDPIRYTVFGNPKEAELLVFSTIPYSTDVSDASIQVRMAVQQEALGNEAALIGVQVYDRKHQPIKGKDREMVKNGDFTPFGRRLIKTIEHIDPRDDQEIVLHGFSMGADVSTEAAHMAQFNQNYGVVDVSRLGIFEPARVADRSALQVINAFSSSGKDLYENVLATDMTSLLEARNIDLSKKSAKSKHGMQVNLGVTRYFLRDLGGNMVLLKGFGHDTTKQQLGELASSGLLMVAGRMVGSSLTPPETFESIENAPNVTVVVGQGDHSVADNLVRGAGMIAHAAGTKHKNQ